MSELSFMILLLSDLKRERISFLSTVQMLHCSVRDDFMHLIPSPCHRMVGVMICFIICRTWLLLLQSLHIFAKCLEKASAPLYPPLPYQLGPEFFLPDSIIFHTSLMCSLVLVLRWRQVVPIYDLPLVLHLSS